MFVDTNVLVAARFMTAPAHAASRACLDQIGQSSEPLRISTQVLREYLAATTRPQKWSNPLPIREALRDIERFIEFFDVFEEKSDVLSLLISLCRDIPTLGKQVHDANIVATMLAHGERRLLTLDTRHFRRFEDHIELIAPD